MTAVLLRHASAGNHAEWEGDERLRPLDRRGRRQAQRLVPLLHPLALRRLVSSPYTRCVETVEPLAATLGLEVELGDAHAEGAGTAAAGLLVEGDRTLACTHGDVVEALLGFGLRKAAAVVVEPDGSGGLRAVSALRPR